MMPTGVTVSLAATSSGVVHVGGVGRCGSVWACPVCAPTIRETRAAEIDVALASHLAAGGSCYFVTGTVRHHAGTPLAQVLDLVAASWRSANNAKSQRGSDVLTGSIRALEITHGRNGWHPHVHALMLFAPGVSAATATAYLRNLSTHWGHQVRRRGGSVGANGFDIRPVHHASGASSYLTKVDGGWGAGLELARGDVKTVRRKGSTSPQEFLRRASDGDRHALKMWLHYEKATLARHAIQWSRGLRDLYDVPELSDLDAAEAEAADAPVVMALVPADDWAYLLRVGQAAEMIGALGDIGAGRPYLWRWPMAWLLAMPAIPPGMLVGT